jgi:4'-phosphopantetheinyl transferase
MHDANSLIPLGSREIHLWLAYCEEIDEELDARYRKLLSAEERAQEIRFRFPRDQRRYLVTRALVRCVLSRYASRLPEVWMFSADRYGRPDIANPQTDDARLSFNISHTDDLVVLAVLKNGAIGVDTENIRTREASIDVARHHFGPSEVEALTAAPLQDQQYRFFEYWTFKEAYIKARGMGLSLPLDKFQFHYPNDHGVEIEIDPELKDAPARWQFWQLSPTPDYLVAICAERNAHGVHRLVVRQTIPMVSEKTVSMKVRRGTFTRDTE